MHQEEGYFKGHDGLQLYHQRWLPEDAPKASLAVLHGLGEHSGRYQDFADWFVPLGYAVYAYDHRGHGKSAGVRGHVNRWDDFREDARVFMDTLRQEAPDVPLFLIGHSMGGLMVLDYALHYPDGMRGVVSSAPALAPEENISPGLLFLAKLLSSILPKLRMDNGLDIDGLCRDPEVVRAYRDDPLVHGFATPRFAVELARTAAWCQAHANTWESDLPLFIVHGCVDPICPAAASARFFENAGARDKAREEYTECMHEVFNEIDRGLVLDDVATWLAAHL